MWAYRQSTAGGVSRRYICSNARTRQVQINTFAFRFRQAIQAADTTFCLRLECGPIAPSRPPCASTKWGTRWAL